MKYLLTGEETERLKFRILTINYFEEWMPLFDSPNTAHFLGLDPSLSKKELTKKWFDKSLHRQENELGGMNVLIDKTSGKMVGQSGLLIQEINGVKRLEVGYSILPEFLGKGYATEAAQKCRDFCFENNYWPDLISMISVDNTASEAVAKKNGMTLEIHLPNYKGDAVNIFSINKATWLDLRKVKQT